MRGKWISVMSLCVLILSSVVFSEETNKTDFTGTVIDSDGAAIEDASLVLYMVTIDQAAFGYQVKPLSKVKSDASGKFAFEVNVPEASGNSIYCCLAQKEELACGWACAISVNSATWQITLGEPKMMIGFVRDPDGTAIADAEVRLIILSIAGRQDQFMFGVEPVEAFVTKTSSDGRFEFNNLPKDATAEFLVKKSGKGTLHTLDAAMNPEAGLTYKAGQTDIVLTMQGACKVSGTVVTKEGQKPVGGVSLMIMEANLPINLINNPVKSGDDGIFEFEDLSPGDYKVQILDDNWIAEPASVTVAGDTDAEVKIELIKGGTLEVKVIDSETKKAVAGTTVNFREEQTRQNQSFSTDNNGIGNKQVMPGTYSISVYKQGYRASRDAGTVVVDNGKTATLTVEFGSQPKITGLVTDPQGKPVEGAVIRIVPGGGSNRDGIKSDEKGQFSMAWDPGRSGFAEGEFFLTASHVEKNLAGVIQIAEDAKEAAIKLEKGITAKGKVVDPDDKPIVGATARLYFHGSRFSSSIGREIATDDNGEYEFSALASGQRYSVNITKADGYGTGQKEVQPASGVSQAVVDDIILRVADLKVTGQVLDVEGEGMADVQVRCYGNGQPNINTKTDKEGKFVLEKICAGEISLSANYRNGQDYQYGHVRTEGGAENIRVIVTSQGTSQRFVPRKPASLVGKALPDLAPCGVDVPKDAGKVIIFAWDMKQRPSRHFIKKFNAKAGLLKEKGVTVILVNTSPVEKEKLETWLQENNIAYPCGVIAENAADIKFKMGIGGLPWLILTDVEHKVVAEGFSIDELEGKLK